MAAQQTYAERLLDPRWQQCRLRRLEADNWTCEECGATASTMHVHHGYYARGLMPWEYPPETLHSLCDNCHRIAEELLAEIREGMGALKFCDLQKIADWLKTGEQPGARDTPLPPLPKSDSELLREIDENLQRARIAQGIYIQ